MKTSSQLRADFEAEHLLQSPVSNLQSSAARRDFLKQLAAASTAAMVTGAPQLVRAESGGKPKATADSCILLWMGGGMAAPDTWDPKRYVPFEAGIPVA